MAQYSNHSVPNDDPNLHHLSELPLMWPHDATTLEFIDPRAIFAGDEQPQLCPELPPDGQGYPASEVHSPEHGQVEQYGRYACFTCSEDFGSDNKLKEHGKKDHPPYGCYCGKSYSQYKSLTRHLNRGPKYSCPVCTKHDGKNAFSRREHLRTHFRRVHKFEDKGIDFMNGSADNTTPFLGRYPCPFCSKYDGADDLLQHLRGTHKCGERGIAFVDDRAAAQPSDWIHM